MPLRVDLGQGLRWGVAGARAGGAILALAVIASSPEPPVVLGLLVVGMLAVGGTLWTGRAGSVPIRVLISIGTVVLARVALGTSGAALAAVLLALGAWLRLGLSDAIVGLAVFGGVVALLGSASLRIAAVFWALGIAAVLVRSHAPRLWRRAFRRRALIAEKTQPAPLAPES